MLGRMAREEAVKMSKTEQWLLLFNVVIWGYVALWIIAR
jgi:hypothetical protein